MLERLTHLYKEVSKDSDRRLTDTFIPTSIGDNSAKGTSRVASSHSRIE